MGQIHHNGIDTFLLRLTAEERQMLLKSIQSIGELKKRIQLMEAEGDTFIVWLTPAEIHELHAATEWEIEKTHSRIQQQKWDRLFLKVAELHDESHHQDRDKELESGGIEFSMLREFLPDDIFQKLEENLKSGQVENLDALNDMLEELMAEYNQRPQEELAGLTPEQTSRLVYSKWDDPNGPIRLNDSIPSEELSGVTILTNARIMLKAILEEGKVKATSLGYFNRKFVRRLFDEMAIPDEERSRVLGCCKVINEYDSHYILLVRILLEFGKLIRRQKGFYTVTRKGKVMMRDGQEGDLFCDLFTTFYRRLNIASYYNSRDEGQAIQDLVAFSLFALKQHAMDWIESAILIPKIFLEPVREEIEILPSGYDPLPWVVESRIFRPLEWFGLLERRELPKREQYDKPYEVRLTPLYQRFLSFYLTDKNFH